MLKILTRQIWRVFLCLKLGAKWRFTQCDFEKIMHNFVSGRKIKLQLCFMCGLMLSLVWKYRPIYASQFKVVHH